MQKERKMTLWIHEPSSTTDRTEIVMLKDDHTLWGWHDGHFVHLPSGPPPKDDALDETFDPPCPYWQKVEL